VRFDCTAEAPEEAQNHAEKKTIEYEERNEGKRAEIEREM
jgi:hypothetical protein